MEAWIDRFRTLLVELSFPSYALDWTVYIHSPVHLQQKWELDGPIGRYEVLPGLLCLGWIARDGFSVRNAKDGFSIWNARDEFLECQGSMGWDDCIGMDRSSD
ncbi:hypothetical protein Nepgr_002711 [Nepenthes gracilis]|uniref:Uncharacterized protein n=1 Tax=Nepenthes gracilis TaxID=150966 RepID=A0AAD3RX58_NEPGR|nr:hypothetical protein Nepgr_002711 [Nepenthes gracilis]